MPVSETDLSGLSNKGVGGATCVLVSLLPRLCLPRAIYEWVEEPRHVAGSMLHKGYGVERS